MRRTLKNLADAINSNLPHLAARVEQMTYTLERSTPGRNYVNARWTRCANGLRVVDKKEPWKTVYELNMACWYHRVAEGYAWLEEQLNGKNQNTR